MKSKYLIGLLAFGAMMNGCAGLVVGEIPKDTLTTATASVIGVPEKEITLSEQKISGMVIYYTAKTKKNGSFSCRAQGGGVAVLGALTSAECTKAAK